MSTTHERSNFGEQRVASSVPRHTNCSRLYFIVHMNMFIVNIKVLLELEFLPVHFLSDGIQTVHSVPQLLSTMLQVKNVFIA